MKKKKAFPFTIKEVDGTDAKVQRQLTALHKKLFKADLLPEFGLGYWWIAYYQGRPVGFTGMHKSKQFSDAGYLIRSGVLSTYRGQGLQRKFIRVRERKARKLGHTMLVSDTTETIHSANNLIREGFTLHIPPIKYGFTTTNYWRKDLWRKSLRVSMLKPGKPVSVTLLPSLRARRTNLTRSRKR